MRALVALLSGGLFGAGLLVSGMVDTRKVQGWLDFFGDWDPTLAFVMGGAILPMALAWRLTPGRAPVLGGAFPRRRPARFDPGLTLGSAMFGAGWGLAGLCPGPSIASLGFGGTQGLAFFAAMAAGMLAAAPMHKRLERPGAQGLSGETMPDIRILTPDYAVAPQIDPEDFAAIRAAGYVRVINNRPDGENPPSHRDAAMRAAAEAAGLSYVAVPIAGRAMAPETVAAHAAALDGAGGPVLAYCASGTRSTIAWALGQAGRMPTDRILGAAAGAGYDLGGLRAALDALAARG